jgi:hypothetical protein
VRPLIERIQVAQPLCVVTLRLLLVAKTSLDVGDVQVKGGQQPSLAPWNVGDVFLCEPFQRG